MSALERLQAAEKRLRDAVADAAVLRARGPFDAAPEQTLVEDPTEVALKVLGGFAAPAALAVADWLGAVAFDYSRAGCRSVHMDEPGALGYALAVADAVLGEES